MKAITGRRIWSRLVIGGLALGMGAGPFGPGTAPVAAATTTTTGWLYPNLKTLPPRDLVLERTDVSVDHSGVMDNVLAFSNTEWNAGPGRLELRTAIDPTTLSGPTYQRVYDSSGNYQDLLAGSSYYHPVHDHYHYDNWGAYQLWTQSGYNAWIASGRTTGTPLYSAPKTSSCAIDEEIVNQLPATPAQRQYLYTGCMPDANGNLVEGLSAGWGDTYDYYRYLQWIDMGQATLADGNYVLRSVADPNNQIYESDGKSDPTTESQADNEGITPVTIQGGALVDTTAPTGTVTINGVDAQTTSPGVTLTLLGRDDVSGVDQLQISNDGVHWAPPITNTSYDSVTMTTPWNLTDSRYGGTTALGSKTVYVQFHDRSGKWGPTTTGTINYVGCPPPSSSGSTYATTVLNDGPVSYWRLGDTCGAVYDEKVLNPGAYHASPLLGQPSLLPSDPVNGAVRFNGSTMYAEIPSSTSLNLTTNFSLEAWIRPAAIPATGSWASVLTKAEAYSLQFNGPRLEFTVIQNGTRRRLDAPAGAVAAGSLYHVVATYDGSTQRLYLNGKLAASAALTGGASTTANPLRLASWDGQGEFYNGIIDEAAVYNKVLSPTQVANHTSAGLNSTNGLVSPTGLTAQAGGVSVINLAWADNATSATGYTVQRDTSTAFTNPVSFALGATATGYQDTGLTSGTTYDYRVEATNSTGVSGWSNVATATTATTTASPYSSAVLNDGAVSYWRLGETSGTTAADTRALNNGTYLNSPTLGQTSLLTVDPTNLAVRFNGVNQYADVPVSTTLDFDTAFSLEAWIDPATIPSAGGWASILTKAESYSLQFNGPQLEFTVIQNGVRRRLDAASGAVVAGKVYHVVGTFDGTTQRLYINGVQAASTALSGGATTTTNDLRIGSWDGKGEFFNGVVDEVAVYRTALAAATVSNHYQIGKQAPA